MTERTGGMAPESGACKVDLGYPEDYDALPAAVTVDGAPCWLVRDESGTYRLLLAVCPHAGGEVLNQGEFLYCPVHFWTFDPADGTCRNAPAERLMQRKVERGPDGRLYAAGELF